ncbi:antitoxin Xre/MbcA/ParS toxin-binding domain-containing protein [Lamprobacter modestohalophilus]|uniref:antitoxin Xre/MbcA/ParS toxin-binding domain-containing protein n=1 Tax=Lamprobacter modestohalophilus TaxID=1064514 RepID=UPI001F5B383E|nr:antitoxin Xre/MbcA/ParS toxin-binding domain-containing protein [Lamprobacter modestohalophilus]
MSEATTAVAVEDLTCLFSDRGLVETDRLAEQLHVTKVELARATGLSRDALSKRARSNSPKTQQRLRDTVDIINRAIPWTGSTARAFAWFRSQPLPSFGDKTAEDLLKEGRAQAVKDYLSRIADGGYA